MSTNSSETHDMNIVRAFTASKKSYQNPTVASLNNQSTMKASTNQLKNKIKDLKVKSKNNLNKMSNYSKRTLLYLLTLKFCFYRLLNF
jgi:hypothetical protein